MIADQTNVSYYQLNIVIRTIKLSKIKKISDTIVHYTISLVMSFCM